jgi:hypothetical protein
MWCFTPRVSQANALKTIDNDRLWHLGYPMYGPFISIHLWNRVIYLKNASTNNVRYIFLTTTWMWATILEGLSAWDLIRWLLITPKKSEDAKSSELDEWGTSQRQHHDVRQLIDDDRELCVWFISVTCITHGKPAFWQFVTLYQSLIVSHTVSFRIPIFIYFITFVERRYF